MIATSCPITGELAWREAAQVGWLPYISPSTGGKYLVRDLEYDHLQGHLSPATKAGLIEWLVRERAAGIEYPAVSISMLQQIKFPPSPTLPMRVERLYRYLRSTLTSISSSLPYQGDASELPNDPWSAYETRAYLRAWTASGSDDDLDMLVQYGTHAGNVSADRRIALTIAGWMHLEAMDTAGAASDQAFVAMWFGDETNDAYSLGIEPAIIEAGYVPMRIDRKEHSNKIDDEIVSEIRRSRFIVADFTCGTVVSKKELVTVPRGGVYYEAGFAQGLGHPVVWTCRADQIERVHFDTRQFNHITWSSPEELRTKLVYRIAAVVGDGPHRKGPA